MRSIDRGSKLSGGNIFLQKWEDDRQMPDKSSDITTF